MKDKNKEDTDQLTLDCFTQRLFHLYQLSFDKNCICKKLHQSCINFIIKKTDVFEGVTSTAVGSCLYLSMGVVALDFDYGEVTPSFLFALQHSCFCQ